jgi:hypothetical protein
VKGSGDGLNGILNRNTEFRAFYGYLEAVLESSRRFEGVPVLFSGVEEQKGGGWLSFGRKTARTTGNFVEEGHVACCTENIAC